MKTAFEDSVVPDMDRRTALNLILAGSIGVNVLGLAVPYLAFFMPPRSGASADRVTAKDISGNEITVKSWLATHNAGSPELAEGIKVGARTISNVLEVPYTSRETGPICGCCCDGGGVSFLAHSGQCPVCPRRIAQASYSCWNNIQGFNQRHDLTRVFASWLWRSSAWCIADG